MGATLPEFSLSVGYAMFIVAVAMSSIIMIFVGGWMKERLQKGGLRFGFAQKSKFRRKFSGFLLFIVGIFLIGWLGERLQSSLYDYLMQNAASSVVGIAVALIVVWFMYDLFVWRKYSKE